MSGKEGLKAFVSTCIDAGLDHYDILGLVRARIAEEIMERTNGNASRAAITYRIHRNNIVRWQKLRRLLPHQN